MQALRLPALTLATMIAFAANSLLCRAALRGGAIDATSFTVLRIASGALLLFAIERVRRRPEPARALATDRGSWRAAVALMVYAPAFSYAYIRLGAGAGALLQFGSAQLTMVGGGLIAGERPTPRQWFGTAVATAGMVVLTAPGLDAPSPSGAALMVLAGIAWGIFSLCARGTTTPVATTTSIFLHSLPFALALGVAGAATGAHVTVRGAVLAAASGTAASALSYCAWYAVVPELGAARAAVSQLLVPVIAAIAAIVLLDEPVTRHVAIGGGIILGGLAVALRRRSVRVPDKTNAPDMPDTLVRGTADPGTEGRSVR